MNPLQHKDSDDVLRLFDSARFIKKETSVINSPKQLWEIKKISKKSFFNDFLNKKDDSNTVYTLDYPNWSGRKLRQVGLMAHENPKISSDFSVRCSVEYGRWKLNDNNTPYLAIDIKSCGDNSKELPQIHLRSKIFQICINKDDDLIAPFLTNVILNKLKINHLRFGLNIANIDHSKLNQIIKTLQIAKKNVSFGLVYNKVIKCNGEIKIKVCQMLYVTESLNINSSAKSNPNSAFSIDPRPIENKMELNLNNDITSSIRASMRSIDPNWKGFFRTFAYMLLEGTCYADIKKTVASIFHDLKVIACSSPLVRLYGKNVRHLSTSALNVTMYILADCGYTFSLQQPVVIPSKKKGNDVVFRVSQLLLIYLPTLKDNKS